MKKIIRKLAELEVTTDLCTRITLIDDESGIILNPLMIKISANKKVFIFRELWLHPFSISIQGKNSKVVVDTAQESTYKTDKLAIRISHFWKTAGLPKWAIKALSPIHNRLFRFGWDYAFKISHIISVCKYLDEEVFNNLGKHGSAVPIPIDPADLPVKTKGLDLRHPAALLIQNHQIKQKSEALVSFKETIQSLPGVTFYISKGLPENRGNKYHDRVLDTLTPLKNVQFVDINSTNKYDYLSSADMYILRSGLDCTPATILEAGLAAKPVIASAVGGVPEMILDGKTGWTLNNKDPLSWVDKIDLLARNPKISKTMGNQNKGHVLENYGINVVAEKLFTYLQG